MIIAVITIFLLGYALGRRAGKKEGVTEGMSLVPLEWRKEMFETSICPLCTQELNIRTNYDNIHNREL
ncbi:MAG: hypothetical protein ACOX8P_06455 [Tepidanaerobacteraceae bacterium]